MFGKLEKELERDFKKNHLKRIKAVIAKKKKQEARFINEYRQKKYERFIN